MAWRRGQSYAQDLRDRVLGVPELSARAAAERFGVSESYVIKARARLRETGEREACAQRNHVASKLTGYEAALRERAAAEPDATLAELCAWLAAEPGVVVGKTGMWKGPARLGLRLEKAPPGGRAGSRQGRASAPGLGRAAAHAGPAPGGVPGRDLGNHGHDAPAWAQSARRASARGSAARTRHTTTFVAGLRADGLVAPLVLNGAMNGATFLAYVAQFLAPTLQPGDVVVMDNLSSHKSLPPDLIRGSLACAPPSRHAALSCATCRLTALT